MTKEKCDDHSGVCKVISKLENDRDLLFRKIDNIRNWVMGIAGGVIVALILLAVNLVINGKK